MHHERREGRSLARAEGAYRRLDWPILARPLFLADHGCDSADHLVADDLEIVCTLCWSSFPRANVVTWERAS